MKKNPKAKTILSLVACIVIVGAGIIVFSGSVHAASRSSHNIAYVTYDDSGFTGVGILSANIFADSVVGGPAPTSSVTASVTYNGMTFTPLAKSAISATTLAPYDTLILFEVCDIATSLTTSQHNAINAYHAAGNKILLYDGGRCAAGAGGAANYSWFTYPFSTSSPGQQVVSGTIKVVENFSLTQGLSSDPFNSNELGDANIAITSDLHWFAAAQTSNVLGNSGFFLAYAQNAGLIIYDGVDRWLTGPTKSLTDLFLNELNQLYNLNNLPSSVAIAKTANYFALGDSYSSGEGNPPFIPPTDGPNDFCHRSQQAYPEFLGKAPGPHLNFYACSGATLDAITTNEYNHEKAQINDLGADANATAGLLTITIGGNDVGFSDVLKQCIELRESSLLGVPAPVADWLETNGVGSCAAVPWFMDSVYATIEKPEFLASARETYLNLLHRVSLANTSVIAVGYPHLFPDTPNEQKCAEISSLLTPADQKFLNTAADKLDDVLQTAAGQAGVNFVDVRQMFKGHGVCGKDGAWINGIKFTDGCRLTVFGRCIIPELLTGSFHPNSSGHASGYAAAIQNYIKLAANRTALGYPANPPALPSPPAPTPKPCRFSIFGACIIPGSSMGGSFPANPSGQSSEYTAAVENYMKSATNRTAPGYPANPSALPDLLTATSRPRDVVQALTVQPVTPQPADCEGVYTAGQEVSVSGRGFAPNASVRLYVTSIDLSLSGQQQVAQFTANATGAISGIIRIPSTAIDARLAGVNAGLTFIDAIGIGPDGVHADDVEMGGLATPGSACSPITQLPFKGFESLVANFPQVNTVRPGVSIPVKFDLPGIYTAINNVFADGYPQSAPVPCSDPASLTSGDPTVATNGSPSGYHNGGYIYAWKTSPSWQGCRELIVKLVDGSYHRAVFNFRTGG